MFKCKMKRVLINLVCFICIGCAFEMGDNNFTFTEKMAMRCKKHLCRNGYSYDTFYKVDALKSDGKDPDIVFEMHIAILAASNGHILLSPIQNPQANDPVYEIVVGGGGNRFTELRRNLRRNAKQSEKTIGILSPIQERAFFIKISEDGVVEFGREGDKLPMISYNDGDPLTINYFSFAAWNGVEAKFYYDCPRPNSNETAPDSQIIEPKLSTSEKLKQALLMDKPFDYASRIRERVEVDIGVRITNVRYDAVEGKLTTGLAVVTSWQDDSMAWNPSKFNGTTRLTFRLGQIWRPVLFTFNSEDTEYLDIRNPGLISMLSTGQATFHFRTQVTSFCNDTSIYRYNRWPHDSYLCSILIGPWEVHEKISLKLLPSDDEKMKHFADIDNVLENEWDIHSHMNIIPELVWKAFNISYQSDRLVIFIVLERNATAYNVAFYTPLLALMTFVLLSFWSPPLEMSRVWFYAGTIVIICMGMCFIDYLVPCNKVPFILAMYITIMMGVLLALFIQIILMTSVMEKVCKSVVVQTVFTAKWFRIMFCLPAMKKCKNYDSFNEAYDAEEDGDSEAIVSRQNVEEMTVEADSYGEMTELAQVIDKLMFIIYSVAFCVLLALHN